MLVDISAESTFTLDQFVTMQEKVTRRKVQMMDAKNLEVERAVNDLIDLIRNYPLGDTKPDPDYDESASKIREHYQRLMYLAILNATKHSFFALKKRLANRTPATLMELTDFVHDLVKFLDAYLNFCDVLLDIQRLPGEEVESRADYATKMLQVGTYE